MISRPISALLLLVCAATSVGVASCTSAPQAEVRSAAPRDRQEAGTVATVYVELENPNNEPLPLRTVEYTVVLTGKDGMTFQGTRAAEATLPSQGKHRLALPAAFPASVDLVGATYQISGTIRYLKPGQIAAILYDYRVSRPSVDFSGSGTIAAADVVPAGSVR